jgi:hypothetical protein
MIEVEARYEGYIDFEQAPQFSFIVNKYGHRKFIPFYGNADNLVIGRTYLLTV